MASIYRRKQIKRITTLIIFCFFIFISIIVFFFYPYGLHKNNLSKINIPKETAIYLSLKDINTTVNKIVDSTYAYRVSYDETLFDLSVTLKSIQTFLNNFSNNKNLLFSLISKYASSRNAAILVWSKEGKNYDMDSNVIYMFDIGKMPTIFIRLFHFNEINILDKKYTILKNKNIKTVMFDNRAIVSFTFYKGLMIVSKNQENLNDIISFMKNKNKKNEIDILLHQNSDYSRDIFLYINKQIVDTLNYDYNNKILNFFTDVDTLCISTKLLNDKLLSDVYVKFRGPVDNKYVFNNDNGVGNIMKYFSIEETTLFFAINTKTSYLYPLLMSNIKKNNSINNTLYNQMLRLDNMYSIHTISKELNDKVGFAYLRNKNKDINYPVIAFEITNEIRFIPFFENVLNKKYGSVNKNEKNYKNNFIYRYDIPNVENKLYYTSKNNIFFMSEEQEAIEIIIDNYTSKKFMDWYLTKDGLQNTQPNAMMRFNFEKGRDIIKDLELPFRTWVYPNDMIMYTWINTNITHFKFTLHADLSHIKIE